ncbi:hypothetical protein SLJ66_004051 [Escherichia coli]|nr:hypothetical protein [Escherichia coli]
MSEKSEEQLSLERDAARYRWLKNKSQQEGRDGGYVQLYTFPVVIKQSYPDVNYGDLDEAIDSQIAKQ